jgi:hypothetical protein
MSPLNHPTGRGSAAFLAVLLLSLSGCAGSNSRHASAGSTPPKCSSRALGLSLTEPISAQIGEHGRDFVLSNRSPSPCVLYGSPRIALYDHGRRLPFVYHYDTEYGASANGVLGERPARPVLLSPGSSAYFRVAKFRCEFGPASETSEIRVFPPGNTTPLQIALPAGGGEYGVSELVYCPTFAPADRIDVTAILTSSE